MRIRLYSGIVREGKWYNHAEIEKLDGGGLTLLKGADRTGAARVLNLIKGSIKSVYTEGDEEYVLKSNDYKDFKAVDSWKIGYEQIKLFSKEKYPAFLENFFCGTCSSPGREIYTEVKESWEKLIEEGYVSEYFQEDKEFFTEIKLPVPFVVEAERTIVGGAFDTLRVEPLSIGDMLQIHHDTKAMKDDASQIYATWDASIVEVKGMSSQELNILKRNPKSFFSEKYLNDPENIQTLIDSFEDIRLGMDATGRRISCRNCGAEVGGRLDFTNFFSPFLQKK